MRFYCSLFFVARVLLCGFLVAFVLVFELVLSFSEPVNPALLREVWQTAINLRT